MLNFAPDRGKGAAEKRKKKERGAGSFISCVQTRSKKKSTAGGRKKKRGAPFCHPLYLGRRGEKQSKSWKRGGGKERGKEIVFFSIDPYFRHDQDRKN